MRTTAAILLLFLAALLSLGESMALLDPVGTRMADDTDPRGDPRIPWTQHAGFVVAIVVCAGGAWLLLQRRSPD